MVDLSIKTNAALLLSFDFAVTLVLRCVVSIVTPVSDALSPANIIFPPVSNTTLSSVSDSKDPSDLITVYLSSSKGKNVHPLTGVIEPVDPPAPIVSPLYSCLITIFESVKFTDEIFFLGRIL